MNIKHLSSKLHALHQLRELHRISSRSCEVIAKEFGFSCVSFMEQLKHSIPREKQLYDL